MPSRFDRFLTEDHDARDRAALISMAVGFSWGVLANGILGREFRGSAYEACLITGAAYVVQIWRYCLVRDGRSMSISAPQISRRLAFAVPSIVLLAALNILPVPSLEAAVLDRRARRLIQKVPLTAESLNKLTKTLEQAYQFQVPLPPRTIQAVGRAVRQTAVSASSLEQGGMAAASAAASAATVNIGTPPDLHYPLKDHLPEANGRGWNFVAIATNTGPDNYSTIGITHEPDVAKMERIAEPLRPASEYGPAFLLVKDLTATLDGFNLKHVIFQDMTLSYNGGPIVLDNVYFLRCQFKLAAGQNSLAFMEVLTKGGWIHFSAL